MPAVVADACRTCPLLPTRPRYKLTAFSAVSIQADATEVDATPGAWSAEGTFVYIGACLRDLDSLRLGCNCWVCPPRL